MRGSRNTVAAGVGAAVAMALGAVLVADHSWANYHWARTASPFTLTIVNSTTNDWDVYVANAVIATYGEQVVDTFYVKDMFGLKYYSEAKQRSLEKRLREAIDAGRARAAE